MAKQRLGFRLGQLGWGLVFAALIAEACGNKDDNPPFQLAPSDSTGGKSTLFGGRAGKDTGGAAGANPGEGGMAGVGDSTSSGRGGTAGSGGSSATPDPAAPTVHVTSPVGVTSPNDSAVIVADELDALCTVTQLTQHGSKPVDPSTVLLELLDADANVVETKPGTPTDNDDEYTAHFITTKVADNGVISFGCQAADTSVMPLVSYDQVDSFVDHGPKIVPADPPVTAADMAPFATAVSQALHVSFQVEEAPVAKGDKGAGVGDVSLTVGGKLFELAESNGTYTATVHLDDATIFTPPPDGDQKIVITATDRRMPKAASTQLAYDFLVDGTGPDITITSPQDGDIWAGRVQMTFTVVDDQSGVDQLTVVVFINKQAYRYSSSDPSWSFDEMSNTYSFNFDTTQFQDSVAQATLSVQASDLVGNESDTRDVLPRLDNVPPFVELDPGAVREQKDTGECSLAFDPVGPEAPNDLDIVASHVTFRAFVWDEAIRTAGDIPRAATVDENSVVLFLQPSPDQGLLKDTTGDGVCDEIETKDSVTGQALPAIQLDAVPSQGTSFFGAETSEENSPLAAQFPMPSDCKYGVDTTAPLTLCNGHTSRMTRVVYWSMYPNVPVIFAVPKLQDVTCTGDSWEIGNFATEGWVCAAARAKDKVGNVGISVPLRLCYDDGVGAPANCSDPPPSCVIDGCRLPPRFPSTEDHRLFKP